MSNIIARFSLLVLLILLLMGCTNAVKESDIKMMQGYWEIEKVVFPNGKEKEYKVNEIIDFFDLKQKAISRKKVKPQFDGSYIMFGDAEAISVSVRDDTAFLEYKTPYAQWKEEIIELSQDKLVLRNEQNTEYHYKRPIPFSIK